MRKIEKFRHPYPLYSRLLMFSCLVCLLAAPSAPGADSGWIRTGPGGGRINALVLDPDTPQTLYAGTADGLYKSTNGGISWNSIYHNLVQALALDPRSPQTLYAGTTDGVCKSTDGGSSWKAAGRDILNIYVHTLTIDPESPQIIYAGTSKGVYKSKNGGRDWDEINNGLDGTYIVDLVIDPTAPQTIYAASFTSIFKSTDGGGNWIAIYKEPEDIPAKDRPIDPETQLPLLLITDRKPPVMDLALDPKMTQTIYAAVGGALYPGMEGGGILRSTDGGKNWAEVPMDLPQTSGIRALAVAPDSKTIYAITQEARYPNIGGGIPKFQKECTGIFKSADGGDHWEAVDEGMTDTSVAVLAINPRSPRTVYAGTNIGVYKSTDGGSRWIKADTGFTNAYVHALVMDPQVPGTIYAGTDGGVFKSSDGGNSWMAANSGLSGPSVYSLAIDRDAKTLYAVTADGLFRSTDCGGNWKAIDHGFYNTTVFVVATDPYASQTVYAGTSVGMSGKWYKSTDGGDSWDCVINTNHPGPSVLEVDPLERRTLYVGIGCRDIDRNGGVYKSTDRGNNWAFVGKELPVGSVCALAIDPVTPHMIYVGMNGEPTGSGRNSKGGISPLSIVHSGIFKSTDGGGNWTAADKGLTNKRVSSLAIDPKSPETVYAGTSGGLFKSTDGGGNWAEVQTGLGIPIITALVAEPDTGLVYAGTYCSGVIKGTDYGGD